jgi:hypothetical protein
MNKYSFWKGVKKSMISVILVGAPLVFTLLPAEWMNLTVGGVAVILLNYLKFRFAK